MTKIGDKYVVVGEVDFDKLTEEERDHLRQMGCVAPDGFLIVPESRFGSSMTMFPGREVVMTDKKYRDAVTGEYVTEEYAEEHPDTTVGETVHPTPPPEPDCERREGD